MCGIFGSIFDSAKFDWSEIKVLARHAEQRGKDASGLVVANEDRVEVFRADAPVNELLRKVKLQGALLVLGHSRLVTNGFEDNQPVVRAGLVVIHNGIITNCDKLWDEIKSERHQTIDTEIIPALMKKALDEGFELEKAADEVLKKCEGVVSAAVMLPEDGRIVLMSNNGSLYVGSSSANVVFSSEEWPIRKLGFSNVINVRGIYVLNIHKIGGEIVEKEPIKRHRLDLVPAFNKISEEEKLLQYPRPELKRCSKCILPETMPFIEFDKDGICNYCHNYVLKNNPKPLSVLMKLVEPYRREGRADCIVPFSGGRDSSMALHLVVKELRMQPVTYTYDWGMVTDLGRRNISRMCARLGVENIIVAADIEKKRRNIRKNLIAWLKRPHLGMISLLTAGDKHFFQHIETVKEQTGIKLNLWGVNPLETTHFKAGFLGIPPAFHAKYIYSQGFRRQLMYQKNRLTQMIKNPGYFNSSLFDTLSGEYWRSGHKKTDYFHLFDFYTWVEKEVDEILQTYNWEKAPDTNTTWRIGDGTAAFYNYIYHTVAGFTEHDTFRSNQVREGQLSRDEALGLVEDENRPRYQNIRWYLDTVDISFEEAIRTINNIPRLYKL